MHTVNAPSQLIETLRSGRSTLWINPDAGLPVANERSEGIDVEAAKKRMERATPLLHKLFPETSAQGNPITSPLGEADGLATSFGLIGPETGRWLVKEDHRLPVAGSVKARGGFHEVLATAESLALRHHLIEPDKTLEPLATGRARALFGQHSIVVGSTGNLGMAIGLLSAALGFEATVHMSMDAKEWKKRRLRDAGAHVVEHDGDYGNAVAQGRAEAQRDPRSHFVDDEYSTHLFSGYAVGARELRDQLEARGVAVDAEHPLFVYLPCGVGGAPGGITFGLKKLFGLNVHCFFAQPAPSPCMLLQLASGSEDSISVQDIGLDGGTEADGMAVSRASTLVAPLMRSRVAGIYTVTDEQLMVLLRHAVDYGGLQVEPSGAAGIAGPLALLRSNEGRRYLHSAGLSEKMASSTHVVWTTGGALVPPAERARHLEKARSMHVDLTFSG